MSAKITILLIFLFCSGAQAQTVQYNQEFQVNTYTESNQYFPSVSSLSDGGFVVCWESSFQDGNASGIFGQIYESSGTKRGEEFQINSNVSDEQIFSKVSGLSGGGFVVCWESYSEDSNWSG